VKVLLQHLQGVLVRKTQGTAQEVESLKKKDKKDKSDGSLI